LHDTLGQTLTSLIFAIDYAGMNTSRAVNGRPSRSPVRAQA